MKQLERPARNFFFITTLTVFVLAVSIWPSRGNGQIGTVQGNDPPNRVLWLHYDYMVTPDHSHAPDLRAIQIVVEAFQRRGITLHIDPVHNAIPERKVVTLQPVNTACAGPDAIDIHDLRATYFHQNGTQTWHYAVFGHRVNCPDAAHCLACQRDSLCGALPDATSVGAAELAGQNFAVAFGSYVDESEAIPLSTQASVFMHELGHNLGLLHGGDVACINYKPNYISIMNYAYNLNGIPIGPAPGSNSLKACNSDTDCGTGAFCDPGLAELVGTPICLRVDYSDRLLPALNEFVPAQGIGGLDENIGVSGEPADTDLVFYFVSGPAQAIGPSYGHIDWNGNGVSTDVHVQADINNDGSFTLLTGFNDWNYLQAYLNTPEYRNGVVRQNPATVSCTSGR